MARVTLFRPKIVPQCVEKPIQSLMIFKQTFAEWEIVPLFKVLG